MDNNSKKTGGRKKGTPNKMTPERRAILAKIYDTRIEALSAIADDMDIREQLQLLSLILPYVLPKAPEERQVAEASPVEELRAVLDAMERAHIGDDDDAT